MGWLFYCCLFQSFKNVSYVGVLFFRLLNNHVEIIARFWTVIHNYWVFHYFCPAQCRCYTITHPKSYFKKTRIGNCKYVWKIRNVFCTPQPFLLHRKKLSYIISLENGCCFGTCLEIRKVFSSTLGSSSFIFLSGIHVCAITWIISSSFLSAFNIHLHCFLHAFAPLRRAN